MLFQSWPFLLFFAVVYTAYRLTRTTKLRLLCLLIASYIFYAWLGPIYLVPLVYASVFDYLVVGWMAGSRRKKPWLVLSIVNNLGLLVYFKYSAFITENVNALLTSAGIGYAIARPGLLLPAGLSFYLLQSMGYVIDNYRGTAERETSLLRYAVSLAFFPKLLAGPIERADNLLPQLRRDVRVSMQDLTDGLSMFVVGLFKKVALADYFALYVNKIYSTPEEYRGSALVLATFLFAWQIYFDFSGYTDMARGIARMTGIRLMLNFNNPYLATGLGDFWRRWHISLSSWFRDYVYIPLGGNRKGEPRTYVNIFVTMIVSGLWHGAAWTFVLWGAVHGLGSIATRRLEASIVYQQRVPRPIKQVLVFTFVTFAWIFFRAGSMRDAWTILTRIFTAGLADPRCPLLAIILVAAVWFYQWTFESRLRRVLEMRFVRVALAVSMLAYLAVSVPAEGSAFIYMQF
jgi:D-alanyl-lipoteichoic acid acyltransferase DltB (MBOAT superfamily)